MATYSRDLLADDLHVSTFAPMAVLVGITVYSTFDFGIQCCDLQMGRKPKIY